MSTDHLALWNQYVRPLGAKYHKLFSASSRASKLLSEIIAPSVYSDKSYRAISLCAKTERTAEYAEMLNGLSDGHWHDLTYFTHVLEHDHGRRLAPKERTLLGDHVVFTYEYDRAEIAFLREQLEWLPNSKKWEKSKIGKLFRHCSKCWADFVGITVVWSGNKSLHIHITFEARTYRSYHHVEGSVHHGLMAHWDYLAADVQTILDPTAKPDGTRTVPDGNLKVPGAFRRLPGGSRILDKDNLLGMPAGTVVPQTVLWERFQGRAASGASALFFEPTKFARAEKAVRPQRLFTSGTSFGNVLAEQEVSYCEDRLREIYTGYPQLVRMHFDDSRRLWVARFKNSPTDCNPSSIMLETHSAILINGEAPAELAPTLALPLGEMIKLWLKRYQQEMAGDGATSATAAGDLHERHPGARMASAINGAADFVSVRSVLEVGFPALICLERMTLVRGPEGSAKTSSIMRRHPEIMEAIDSPGLAMYAFGDYANAEEKCDAFNLLAHPGLYGVVWKSFSRAYKEICDELGLCEISHDEAIKAGNQSRWSLVERRQPEALSLLRQRHADMWTTIGDRKPVLFGVHAVAHRWKDCDRTRRLWARSFWDEAADAKEQIAETDLALLVHDEIKVDTFADAIPAEAYQWLRQLKAGNAAIWDGGNFARQREAIAAHVTANGKPIGIGTDDYEVRSLLGPGEWSAVVTKDTGEYVVRECDQAEKDIYGRCHDLEWHVRSKNWWNSGAKQIASRIIFLTTELVPAVVAKHAVPRLMAVDFDTSSITRDKVEVRPRRSVTADKLGSITQAEWEAMGQKVPAGWRVISNRKATFDQKWGVEVMTHAAARGSNALIGNNIIQTCAFMASEQYEAVQALNAWTGRYDLVTMTHVDEINQSCGRNLGFRRIGGERHILLINKRLYETLEAQGAFAGMRYDFELHLDAEQRREARRA